MRLLIWPAVLSCALLSSHAPVPPAGPRVFAPGTISGPASDLSPAFTPDGRTVLFTRSNGSQYVILISHLVNGAWSAPRIAPFSGRWRDLEPTMAPDGSYLIFASNRPAAPGDPVLDGFYNGSLQPGVGGNLWRVDRTAGGWGEPHRLPDVINANPSVFSPSVAGDGSLYFMQPSGPKGRFHIFRSQLANGSYAVPVPVAVAASPDTGDFDPAVAPDESFMVFSSARMPDKGASLFISFQRNGVWTVPVYLGDDVSWPGGGNIEARLGADHRTLYFSSRHLLDSPVSGRSTAELGLARMAAWNNGLANIWRVSLDRWLTPNEVALDSSPVVLDTAVISTPAEEFKAALAPDGGTLLYTETDHRFRHMTIVQAERRGDGWAAPEVAPFSGMWRDGDPAFAPDGRSLFFISNRPLPGDPPGQVRRDFNIWLVPRNTDGTWGTPRALNRRINTDTAEFAPSLSTDGALYFGRGDHIFRAAPEGAGFAAPQPLSIDGGDPFVSADGRMIVLDAAGRIPGDADLFVSCRTPSGWSTPRRFAEPVNSAAEEGDPALSTDGRTLFFFSRRFAPARDRAPRARPATYAEIEREARGNAFNGSRNLYQVPLRPDPCPEPRQPGRPR